MAKNQKVDAANFKAAFLSWSAAEKQKLTPGLLLMLRSDADLAREVDDTIVKLGLRRTRKKIVELGMDIKESDLTEWHKTTNPDHYKEPTPKSEPATKANAEAEADADAAATITDEIAAGDGENSETVSEGEGDPIEQDDADDSFEQRGEMR